MKRLLINIVLGGFLTLNSCKKDTKKINKPVEEIELKSEQEALFLKKEKLLDSAIVLKRHVVFYKSLIFKPINQKVDYSISDEELEASVMRVYESLGTVSEKEQIKRLDELIKKFKITIKESKDFIIKVIGEEGFKEQLEPMLKEISTPKENLEKFGPIQMS